MRTTGLLCVIVLCGCERPDDRWTLRSTNQVILRINTVDPSAEGLSFDDEPRFDVPNNDVTIEWWEERQTVLPGEREQWVRVQIRDVPLPALTCSDTATVTLWWDNVDWDYNVRIEPNDYDGAPIEMPYETTGAQINENLSFMGGEFTVEHPCVAEGAPIAQTIYTQWVPVNTQRGLESPPLDQRR